MKNIIFDLGGVILCDKPISVLKQFNVTDGEYSELSRFFSDWKNLDLGIETLEEKLLSCNFSCELLSKYKHILLNYYEYRAFNKVLVDLIDILKKNDYNVFILSDNNKECYEYYKKVFSNIDGWCLSCDYNTVKSEGKLFQILIDKFNLDPMACYFIDDKIDNINIAESYGIKGYKFDEHESINFLYDDMEKNGIKLDFRRKLILFDWGNIVESHSTGYNCYDAWNDLFAACGYKSGNNVYDYLSKYNLNCIDSFDELEKVYNEISNDFSFNVSYNEFVLIFKRIFDKVYYYQDVADYEVSLRDRCYVGILSNLMILDKERLDKQVNLSNYDYVFLSFEMGVSKPNYDIYEKVMNSVPFSSKDILFIDDRDDNIESAKRFGWNVLKATGLELDKIKFVCDDFISNGQYE